jgi:hypothetical protein
MTDKVPFVDFFFESDAHPDETKPVDRRISRPKATFQWPPDCLWPFIDGRRDTET